MVESRQLHRQRRKLSRPESVSQPDNVEVVAVALTGSDGEERAQRREELEDDLQRLEDEKSKHARMKAVIDMEMDAQVAEVQERKDEQRALDERIAKEEKAGGATEVVELLKAGERAAGGGDRCQS